MKILASAEDYLEAVLVLGNKNGKVRAIDIANHMSFSKPTVSIIMKQFRENGYIEIDSNRNITLTEKGAEIASKTYERHNLIAEILMSIGVDEETAYEDACKVEHCLSEKSFDCIKQYYEKKTSNKPAIIRIPTSTSKEPDKMFTTR
jgi:Mn-dependent DtxR family transcriptional regulator